jgi:hypothetical protein
MPPKPKGNKKDDGKKSNAGDAAAAEKPDNDGRNLEKEALLLDE